MEGDRIWTPQKEKKCMTKKDSARRRKENVAMTERLAVHGKPEGRGGCEVFLGRRKEGIDNARRRM